MESLKLVWRVSDSKTLEFALNQTLKIGRNPQNDIQILDQLVSGSHATIRDGIITDKSSTNGTLVNGQELPKDTPRVLQAGDEISIGDSVLSIKEGHPYSGEASNSDHKELKDESDHAGVTEATTISATHKQALISDHEVLVLRKNCEALRSENLKMKGQLNPQRRRQEKQEQKRQLDEMRSQVFDLQHQLAYGHEFTELAQTKLGNENEELRRSLEEAALKYSRLQQSLETLERDLTESKYKHLSGPQQPSAAEDISRAIDTLSSEMQKTRNSVQKLYLTVMIFTSAVLITCGYLFGRPAINRPL